MILSLSARVSPCFILILFLSKHFMAYLTIRATDTGYTCRGNGVPFNTFTELTFFPCLPSCSRTPLQSRPCRWSDARWSHSWSAEGGERSTETLTQAEEKHGLPLRDRKLWVDVPVWFRLLLRPTIWKSGCLFPDISGFGSSAGVFHWMEGIAKEPHGSLQTH